LESADGEDATSARTLDHGGGLNHASRRCDDPARLEAFIGGACTGVGNLLAMPIAGSQAVATV
jgi:hypothetical protein